MNLMNLCVLSNEKDTFEFFQENDLLSSYHEFNNSHIIKNYT